LLRFYSLINTLKLKVYHTLFIVWEVEGVGGEVKGGQLAGKGVPLMVAP